MCELTTIAYIASAVATTASAYTGIQARNQALEYNAKVEENNALIADYQAEDFDFLGQKAEATLYNNARTLKSSQLVAAAGSGVSVGSGSVLNIVDDVSFTADADAMTIRRNTAKNVWGAKVQSTAARNRAKLLESQVQDPFLATIPTALAAGTNLAKQFGGKK